MFKDIPWYEWLYQVSEMGEVKSMYNWRRGIFREKLLSARYNSWYYSVVLCNNCHRKWFLVHRLVAITFIPNPNNYPLVMHLDNDTSNNNITNLKWGTDKHNSEQRVRDWRWNNYLQKYRPKYTLWMTWILCHKSKKVYQYTLDWIFIKLWDCGMDIKRELWIQNSSISDCCTWKRKTAWWFIWKYF